MILDRTQAPPIHTIDTIAFEQPLVVPISPYCQLVCITNVQNETAKFELLFDAGTTHVESEIPSLTNGLLLTGTNSKKAVQINAEIDNLGGFVEQTIGMEVASVGMYSLREHLFALATIVVDAINGCVFDSHELKQHIHDRQQKLNVSLEKVSTTAQRLFKQQFFANSPKYSRITQQADFETISPEALRAFHQQHYLKGLRKIVLVGNFEPNEIEEFKNLFGGWAMEQQPNFEANFINNKGYFHHEKKDALQTAIRIGTHLFNKTHADYPDFIVLNTIIGDYFGSRLMKNIREDKGYTYGIGSWMPEFEQAGYWAIGTEVGVEVKEQALEEIKREIHEIRTTLVSQQELDLVKNYLIGQLLKSADGPYSMMDLFLDVNTFGLDMDFYNQLIHSINNISPERLIELANKYLKWEDFTIVTAGGI